MRDVWALRLYVFAWARRFAPGVMAFFLSASSFLAMPFLWEDTGMPLLPTYIMTIVASLVGTVLFVFWARLPAVAAPFLGLNLWLVYGMVYAMGLSFQTTLLALLLASLWLWLFASVPMLPRWLQAIPSAPLAGARGGLGLWLILHGLLVGKLLLPSPMNLTTVGNIADPSAFVALWGLLLVLAMRLQNSRLAVFWGTLGAVLLALFQGFIALPTKLDATPEGLDRVALQVIFGQPLEALALSLALFLVLFLDSQARLWALNRERSQNKRAFQAIALTNAIGSLLGVGPLTVADASFAARLAGNRKRWAAVAFIVLGWVFIYHEPIAKALLEFPAVIAPAFIVSGGALFFISLPAKKQFDAREQIAYLTTLLMTPLAANVIVGLAAGLSAYVLASLASGKGKELSPVVYCLALLLMGVYIALKL